MAQEINRYNTTPRKVFDKHVDAMEWKRLRDREDHRNDLKAILQRITNLEDQLTQLILHVDRHCEELFSTADHGTMPRTGSTEGLE